MGPDQKTRARSQAAPDGLRQDDQAEGRPGRDQEGLGQGLQPVRQGRPARNSAAAGGRCISIGPLWRTRRLGRPSRSAGPTIASSPSAGRIARKNGLAAASVSRVMHGAGLTIGGFYAHFRSKRAMDAEVVQATLGGSSTPWSIDRYLTAAHRDDAEQGCAFPAMLSEIARADEPTRMAMARAIDARARELARVSARTRRGVRAAARAGDARACASAGSRSRARCAAIRPATRCCAACRKWAAVRVRSTAAADRKAADRLKPRRKCYNI